MRTTTTPLGTCPDCTATIPRRQLLIAYETGDGQARFAECPGCGDVVHPA